MSLEASFADFRALGKCSQDSAIGKLSHDSVLPPVVKHILTASSSTVGQQWKAENALDARVCDSIFFQKSCFSTAVLGVEICL